MKCAVIYLSASDSRTVLKTPWQTDDNCFSKVFALIKADICTWNLLEIFLVDGKNQKEKI